MEDRQGKTEEEVDEEFDAEMNLVAEEADERGVIPEETDENHPHVILRARRNKKRKFVDYNKNANNNTKSKNNYNDDYYNKNNNYSEQITATKSNSIYQELTDKNWSEIKSFLEKLFNNDSVSESQLSNFFSKFPNIIKGNVETLQKTLDEVASGKNNLNVYQKIMQYFLKEFYKPKPAICECHFFPNPSNEKYILNILQSCTKTLDVAIFSLTRNSISNCLVNAKKRGIKVRCIADDECVKNYGSDIYTLAANDIDCKTDDQPKYHMHNKYAIIDNSVIVTGSFNWTTQAINNNQENILIYENKEIAEQYTQEFNRLWEQFTTVIDKQTAIKKIADSKKNK